MGWVFHQVVQEFSRYLGKFIFAEMRTDLDLRGTYEKSNERTYG